ncbi:MAG: hypothetical protein KBB52_08355 [Candidatus Omnitrophica bacterium]|nr:hypothetical protein [Candidatus Omnitrophota bacterium]
MVNKRVWILAGIVTLTISLVFSANSYSQDDDSTRNILKQGLLGAGTGAIASGASGGDAGKGALIGAGTNVIGSALLDAITGPSQSSRSYRSAPPPQYYDDGDYYYEEPVYYEEPPQESSSSKIIKQGLVGAGTGALASSMSGGDAGKGALIGAGTNVIGNALLDTLTQPSQQRSGRVYRRMPPPQQQRYPQSYQRPQVQQTSVAPAQSAEVESGQKRVIKKYDENGKLVSEEEIYY